MSEDKAPEAPTGPPGGDMDDGEDVLRRAAREIRRSAALQAFVPMSAAERERLFDAAFALAAEEDAASALEAAPSTVRGAAVAASPVSEPAASAASASSSPSVAVRQVSDAESSAASPAGGAASAVAGRVLRPRFRVRTMGAVVAATVAMAAVLALVLHGGRGGEPLASYAMIVEGEQATRGSAEPAARPDAPVELHPETRLVLRLTAAAPERDALLRVVLVRDGRATLLDPPITRTQAGALVIEGPAAALLGAQADGAAALVVVLGRTLPADDEVRALAVGASADVPRSLQVLRQAIRLAGFSHTAVDVLLGGCGAVVGAPGDRTRCEIAAGTRLHVWVGAPAAGITIALDGHAIAAAGEPRAGGAAFALELAHAGVLSVQLGARELAAWDIAPAVSFAHVRAADEARRAGRIDEAAAELAAIAPDASAEERLAAVRQYAKLARRRGDAGEERTRREQAVVMARALGQVSAESDETTSILYGLRNEHAFGRAAPLFPALDAHGTRYTEGAVSRELVRGMFASELGDLGTALAVYQRAVALADRIGDAEDRAIALGPLASVLQSLGRDEEAAALIDAEIQRGARGADACARVDALTTAGWVLRELQPDRALDLAGQAVTLATADCPRLVPISLVNQGWLFAAARRFGDARAVLDRIARLDGTPDARVTTWTVRLEAETVLGEDPARAEQHAQQLAERAEALCSTELAYEAHLLRARALVLLDHPVQAAAAFAAAEDALTLWSRLVPLGEGRDTFFERHDQLALAAIPFFLDQIARGTPGADRALATMVRRSLARFVTSLAAGGQARARAEHGPSPRDQIASLLAQTPDRWPVRGELLPRAVDGVCAARDAEAQAQPPTFSEPPSQATLFVHPSPRGLLLVAWRGSSIALREIDRATAGEAPAQLAARIARTAATLLAGVPRLHLQIHRTLAGLPLDRSLAALLAVPVAFAVDAPARPAGARCHGAPRALLVVNPRNNLWAASDAAPVLRGDLERRGFVVDTLEGAAATRAAIEAGLADPCVALLHYDGHGAPAGGALTWDRTDDALLLAGDEALTAAGVLGLARVPDAVVLNGCTTAAAAGLGLAQAFVLAGATRVVASLDAVHADEAAAFTRRLFASPLAEAHATTTGVDLVALFARAIAEVDVPALRAFER